jgi:cell division protein ZapA (FtsZ GTPase activity inhibitor)
MADPSKAIRVEIYDRVYQLRSEAGESYTRRLAQSVDTVMRSIAQKTQTYDSLRLAVLAALHFADECERSRERYETLSTAVAEKSLAFRTALERAGD